MKKPIKLLLMILLGIAGICLSGCYQRFYCKLKTDHLLVSAVDYTSFSKLSMSKTESDFDKICEKHKLNFSEKDSLWGYNSILWSNGKKHRSISVYAVSKKHTTITFRCRDIDVSIMQSIIKDFKSYLQRNNITFKENHYTRKESTFYLLN